MSVQRFPQCEQRWTSRGWAKWRNAEERRKSEACAGVNHRVMRYEEARKPAIKDSTGDVVGDEALKEPKRPTTVGSEGEDLLAEYSTVW